MIVCTRAEVSVDLVYSAIKFLEFDDFTWSAHLLPLEIAPLGELVQADVRLTFTDGTPIQSQWDGLRIFADFQAGHRYKLKMRLEYQSPFSCVKLEPDFSSIRPNRYRFMVTVPMPDDARQSGLSLIPTDAVPKSNLLLDSSIQTQAFQLSMHAGHDAWSVHIDGDGDLDMPIPAIEWTPATGPSFKDPKP